ncbi:haloacid dehalogenase-like hydrolase [Vibrio mimicus]|uniref:HAD family hydrolase n=1 Tax=Vibrio mimicus TaxID=674 RepID=UPI0011D48449|nr:HAD family hydrolase [Vibrio mimicus]TXZ76548.1 haloacid dehalogenase-like hydrolase [Vibrio mimicus]
MKILPLQRYAVALLLGFAFIAQASAAAKDPLPSWNDSAAKSSIIEFVQQVTDKNSEHFVPQEKRIATFDNDGTLWSEQPMYFQVQFALDRIKTLAPKHPEWKTEEPYASILKGDLKNLHTEDLIKVLYATHTGMTTDEFDAIVKEWIATAIHPTTGKKYTEMVFQPMLEVLDYLRANGFKTFIVSGGGTGFMRAWATEVYQIPPEQIVGSTFETEFVMVDGKPVLKRLPNLLVNDDKEVKVQQIYERIGQRPIAAFGNSDGDLAMLQWTAAGEGLRLPVYIHHTDDKREWRYDRESHIGKLDKGLDEAKAKNWPMVDMKTDWKTIYPH